MKPLVTQELVFEAADHLVSSGDDPSIIAVQQHIGGGSYTTVKRYLDAWKVARKTTTPTIALPPEIVTQGQDFVRSLWVAASSLAEQRIAEIRQEAEHRVQQAQSDLAAAETAISQLEAHVRESSQQLENTRQELAQVRENLGEAQTLARVGEARVVEQATQINDLKRQTTAQADEIVTLRSSAADAIRLSGEIGVLRQRIEDQSALIERLTRRS